jgi:hypothetical protein
MLGGRVIGRLGVDENGEGGLCRTYSERNCPSICQPYKMSRNGTRASGCRAPYDMAGVLVATGWYRGLQMRRRKRTRALGPIVHAINIDGDIVHLTDLGLSDSDSDDDDVHVILHSDSDDEDVPPYKRRGEYVKQIVKSSALKSLQDNKGFVVHINLKKDGAAAKIEMEKIIVPKGTTAAQLRDLVQKQTKLYVVQLVVWNKKYLDNKTRKLTDDAETDGKPNKPFVKPVAAYDINTLPTLLFATTKKDDWNLPKSSAPLYAKITTISDDPKLPTLKDEENRELQEIIAAYEDEGEE